MQSASLDDDDDDDDIIDIINLYLFIATDKIISISKALVWCPGGDK